MVPPPLRDDRPIFRRDCLEVSVRRLSLFVCHFKAPYPDPAAAWPVRRAEASAVRRLIERRFPVPGKAWWLVLGDLNEPWARDSDEERAIVPLLENFAIDLAARMVEGERWSYRDTHSGHYSQPDALLASPALAGAWPDARPSTNAIQCDGRRSCAASCAGADPALIEKMAISENSVRRIVRLRSDLR